MHYIVNIFIVLIKFGLSFFCLQAVVCVSLRNLLIKFFLNVVNMNRNLNILLALLVASIYCAQAQVLIGADREPHPGAILELESNTNHGLLLPKVNLTNIADWGLSGSTVEGMLVFNEAVTFTNGNGKGIYIWLNDAKWHLAAGIINTLEDIELSPSVTMPKYYIFTAFVPAIVGAQSYKWLIPTGILGSSNTNVISLVGINAGTYDIEVRAVNSQGVELSKTKSVIITN
jgi:hypothetical protein